MGGHFRFDRSYRRAGLPNLLGCTDRIRHSAILHGAFRWTNWRQDNPVSNPGQKNACESGGLLPDAAYGEQNEERRTEQAFSHVRLQLSGTRVPQIHVHV
jgi:hypothetical protein